MAPGFAVLVVFPVQPPRLQVWGNPACFEGSRFYETCCYDYRRSIRGHFPCWEAGRTFEECCFTGAGTSLEHRVAGHSYFWQGCEAYDDELRDFRFRGGCFGCSANSDEVQRVSTEGLTRLKDASHGKSADCPIADFIFTFSAYLGMPITADSSDQFSTLRRYALMLLDALEREQGSPATVWDLLGITPTQARYMLFHDHPSAEYAPFAQQATEGELVLDLGMSGGMDVAFYLRHGYRVIAVEANVNAVEKARKELPESNMLEILNAAITDGSTPEVTFLINGERPDMSALPGTVEAGKILEYLVESVTIPTTTCERLLTEAGQEVHYMKVDVEGAGDACLGDLERVPADRLPRYLSMELPNLNTEGEAAGKEARDMLRRLHRLGYTGFKVARQSTYNGRVAASENELGDPIAVTRQGLGYGAAGLFGEDAVDFLAGPRWRDFDSVLGDLAGPAFGHVWMYQTMGEWFDLHCAL
mmetsp:Transcript_2154/g.4327  ORF Transcript_2154/g.4327 Transcript_2154/m.4327 type:complete len:474 (-) Transcript_2154:163-1584(-)